MKPTTRSAIHAAAAALTACLVCVPAWAANEARVRVEQEVEGQKKPQGVEGVKVTFTPKSTGEPFECTTDKRGRCDLPRVNTLKDADIELWRLQIEMPEGRLPIETTVEIRTPSTTGVGKGPLTTGAPLVFRLDAGLLITNLKFTALGTVDVHVEAGPETEVRALMQEAVPEAAAEAQAAAPRENFAVQALELANQGKHVEALPKFEKAMQDEGDDPEFLLAYAKVCYTTQTYDKVEDLAGKILELDTDHLGALTVLGAKRAKLGEWDKAIEVLTRASALAPSDRDVMRQLLFVASRSETHAKDTCKTIEGNYDELVLELTEAEDVELWLSINSLCNRAGSKKLAANAIDRAEAIQNPRGEAQKQTEIDPDAAKRYSISRYNQGAAILQKPRPSQADLEEATAALQKALESRPDYVEACKLLGTALIQLKFNYQNTPPKALEALRGCTQVIAAEDQGLHEQLTDFIKALENAD